MGNLDTITDANVANALPKIKVVLKKYCWLQSQVHKVNVSMDKEFQRTFNGFYKVRRRPQWQTMYYGLMEEAKSRGIAFAEILHRLLVLTDRIEASFASKLVATLNPEQPVIDKFVLKNFGLHLPVYSTGDREKKTIGLYEQLRAAYEQLRANEKGRMICEKFRASYPDAGIAVVKMIDLVLWKIRPDAGKLRIP